MLGDFWLKGEFEVSDPDCFVFANCCFLFCSVVQQQVKPVLEKLRQDADGDVQYYSVEALESMYAHLHDMPCGLN